MRLSYFTGALIAIVMAAAATPATAAMLDGALARMTQSTSVLELAQGPDRDPADRIGAYDRQGATRIAPSGVWPQRQPRARYDDDFDDDFAARDRDDRRARAMSPRWSRWCARNSWHPDCDPYVWNRRGWLGDDRQTRMGSGRIVPHAR